MQHVNINIASLHSDDKFNSAVSFLWTTVGASYDYILVGHKRAPLLEKLGIPFRVSDVQGDAQIVFVKEIKDDKVYNETEDLDSDSD